MGRVNLRLEFEVQQPTDHPSRPQGGTRVDRVDEVKLLNKFATGELQLYGFICKDVDLASLEVEGDSVHKLDANCFIVYLGGTAYRICT